MAVMQLSNKYIKILVGCSVGLLVLTGLALLYDGELSRPWKKYQRRFIKLDKKITAEEIAEATSLPDGEEKEQRLALLDLRKEAIEGRKVSIKQLWLTDLGITDRCMTCHAGVEYPRFADVAQPLTTHPEEHIASTRHSVDQYGCVVCHAGQGVALDAHEAHGESHNWVEPFLPGTRAESSCSGCHPINSQIAEQATIQDAPVFSRGRALYMTNNCLGCHVLEGYERPGGIGPTLTQLGTKTSQAWTGDWIKNPKGYLAQTVMPDFELPDDEIKAMAGYLFSLKKPVTDDAFGIDLVGNPDAVTAGAVKLEELGCLGCHGVDGKDSGFGPDLSRAGEKMTPEWLYAWIKDPKKYWPQTAMPNLRVPDKDAKQLVAYLSSLQGNGEAGAPAAVTAADLVEKGRLLIRDKGCTGCHKIGEFALGYNAPEHNGIGSKRVDELVFGDADIPHTLSDWLTLKVKNPRAFNSKEMPTLMPRFGFNDEETEALLTFLLSIRSHDVPPEYVKVLNDPAAPAVRGEMLLERNNCRGCHKIGTGGGTIGPDLSFEGERINPKWLTGFLQKPYKVRPIGIEPTRMPTFGLSAEESLDLAAFFADRNGVDYPYYIAERQQVSEQDTEDGWRFFFQSFSCQACHAWNGQGGIIGPDQSDLGNRLRQEWVAKYLKNPQAFIPDVRMPNFELYDEEIAKLSTLLAGFTEVTPGVWAQIRKRFEDEMLARQAARQMGGQ